MLHPKLIVPGLVVSLLSFACSSDEGGETDNVGGSDAGGASGGGDGGPAGGGSSVDQMLAEIEAKGLFDYVGSFTPDSEETAGNVTKYWFDVTPDGPQCIDSSPFGISVRDQGAENLVIFLMGGGACWTNFAFCSTSVEGQIENFDSGGGIGVVNASDPANPTADWNHVFVPYCDGSVFVGDREVDLFDETTAGGAWAEGTEVMHGLQNISAALDAAKAKFSSPKRILLTGTSAGGFGTLWATGIARRLWRDAELLIFNDAGLGIVKESDPEYRRFLESEWGAVDRFPESCTECDTSAHAIPIIPWGLERDPGISAIGAFSSYGDDVIAGVFLAIPDEEFESALLSKTDEIHAEYPDRFRRFFIEGGQHTVFAAPGGLDGTTKDGVTAREWLTAMIEGDRAAWTDMP